MPPHLGRVELEILRYITDHAPISVREVGEHLAQTKGHTRTTALNMMERLRGKGYLTREKREGIYVYSPSMTPAQLMRGLVRDFVEGTLGGSVEPFVAYLAEEAHITETQLDELRQLVDGLDHQREEQS